MDDAGPDYCYRCKKIVPCECGDPVVTHDGWIKILEDKLNQATKWYREYPRPAFVEPTKEQWLEVHHLLNKHGYTLSDITASRRKHVLSGIGKIING